MGRPKGSRNKVSSDSRRILAALVEKRIPDLDAMIEDTWRGIEIEKTMIDPGTGKQITVLGRLNADPAKAAKLVLEATEFSMPKLQRIEKTIEHASDEELLAELRRRERIQSDKEPTPSQEAIQ
jgi:hypothetical protein